MRIEEYQSTNPKYRLLEDLTAEYVLNEGDNKASEKLEVELKKGFIMPINGCDPDPNSTESWSFLLTIDGKIAAATIPLESIAPLDPAKGSFTQRVM